MRKLIFFLFLLLLGLSSCKKDPAPRTIDSDIFVNLVISDNLIFIAAETEKAYPCLTHSIAYSLERIETNFNIDFIEIIEPENCYAAFGPAITNINLGKLEQGTYSIMFSLNGIKTVAELIISSKSSLSIANPVNVKIMNVLH